MEFVYAKEGIQVSDTHEVSESSTYHYLKTVEDNAKNFPNIARIPNVMLQKVDPVNPILVEYLTNISPSVETGTLLDVSAEGSSKNKRGSKKIVQESSPPASPAKVSKKSSKGDKASQ